MSASDVNGLSESMMTLGSDYRLVLEGGWRLWLHSERWDQGLWPEILRHLAEQAPSRHPGTRRFHYPRGAAREELFLKVYYRWELFGCIKDLFRDSRAFRALRQGLALTGHGFHAPPAIAAGEERRLGLLKRAFLLTAGVPGLPLDQFLRERFAAGLNAEALRRKRRQIEQLAREIRRMHRLGFVHGDLVPSNILLRVEQEGIQFFYMDNDRTRLYPPWFPHRLWKRNLVQLNRFVLPGISLQDRMRFLRAYLGQASLAKDPRRLLRWLERKTRQRRRECEQIAARVSFRELMRWDGPFSNNIR